MNGDVIAEPDKQKRRKNTRGDSWHSALASAIRDPAELLERLGLPTSLLEDASRAASRFPLMVTESFLRRIEHGNLNDPLLRQILPLGDELRSPPGFMADAVGDANARVVPGLLHKYHGRALLIATGACAIHCRYCFRREYPYGDEPRRLSDWQPALDALAADESITEVILSGGDPLMLTDARLRELIELLGGISHLSRLRIHSRLPIVLPERMTDALLSVLTETRLRCIFVVHANHANELSPDCAAALRSLIESGITVLNQAVLLRGINDSTAAQFDLCESLINLGVMPYYLHALDRVAGTAHFEASESTGLTIIKELRERLPGYAVPNFVREVAGAGSKTPLLSTESRNAKTES